MPLWTLTEPIHVGKILKPHSYLGTVKVAFFMPGLEDIIQEEGYLFVEWNKKPVPYFIEEIQWTDEKTALIKLADINSETDAAPLREREILLSAEEVGDIEVEEPAGAELIGFAVEDMEGHAIGRIQDVFDTGPQSLLQVIHKGREYFIPAHKDLIKKILVRKKTIRVDLPEGLMEL